jgi:spermidine synthase
MRYVKLIPAFSLFLIGFNAIVGQVILIRELLIAFSGNELAIGIFLANLLLLEAIGSFIASYRVERSKTITLKFISLQILLSFSLPLIIFLIRIIKTTLGILPGESINLLMLFLLSLLLLLPFGLLNGALFSFACRLLSNTQEKNYSIVGKVYILESAGSIVGGLAVTFLALRFLNSFQSTTLLIVLTLLSSAILWAAMPGMEKNQRISLHKYQSICLIMAGILSCCCLLLGPWNDYLHQQSIRRQWPGYEVLSYKNSIYGNVTLLKQMDQYIVLANGIPAVTFPIPDITACEDFAHLPFLFHTSAKKVLLIGGGPGSIISELLKHEVQEIDYAELDPLLLETIQQYVPATVQPGLNDARVQIHAVDGRFFLQQVEKQYDIILLNLPDPANLEINRFYTTDFFKLCRKKMTSGGLLVFQLPGSATYLNQELINLNGCLLNTTRQIFGSVLVIPDELNLFLATDDSVMLATSPDQQIDQFKQQKIVTRMITPVYLHYKLSVRRQADFLEQTAQIRDIGINTDLSPIALYYSLAYHYSINSPRFVAWMQKIPRIRPTHILLLLFSVLVPLAWIFFRIHRSGLWKNIIVLPVIGSGFTGIGIPVVFMLLFQSLFGYIYLWIGLLVTSFMTGLTTGSIWITGRLNKIRNELREFIILLILLTVYLLIILIILAGLKYTSAHLFSTTAMKIFILAATACCGFLVGAQFPLANKIYLGTDTRIGQAGGLLYSADLAGAWLGGLIVTALLIPVFGLINTVLVFLLLNLISLCFLVLLVRKYSAPGGSAAAPV